MQHYDAREGRLTDPVGNIEERNIREDEGTALEDETDRPLGDPLVLPLGAQPLAGQGILPVGGALGVPEAAGGMFGSTQGMTGPLLPGASLYPVIAPLGEYADADQSLADRAEAALAEDGRLSAAVLRGVRVEARNRGVRLTGHVPTGAEREIAEKIAAHVSGAHGVDNRLTVG